MKRNIFVLLCFSLLLCSSCLPSGNRIKGNGELVTEKVDVSTYDRIVISGTKVILNYTQSDQQPSLQVHTDRNIYEMFQFITEGSTLKISPKEEFKNNQFRATQFTVTTNSASLVHVATGGSSVINVNNPLIGEKMDIYISGGADFYFHEGVTLEQLNIRVSGGGMVKGKNLQLQNLHSGVSGGGRIILNGEATFSDYKVSGGGTIDAKNLVSREVEAKVSGGGKLQLHVLEKLDAKVSGGGSLHYQGTPAVINRMVSGGGSVKPIN
ncbi:MAG: DUF2807 domain-containing protein [Tannerellaceae bacterium]|nr:DUF2807 domain-containing protein [Tannerellaceae bacterium]